MGSSVYGPGSENEVEIRNSFWEVPAHYPESQAQVKG